MIRNVVMGRLKPDADTGLLDQGLAGIVALDIEGMSGVRVGRDAGLRTGNWDFTITADFADAAAYRTYDEDDEHNRLRREIFGPLSAEIARIQIEF
ncbi:Dabb family protein [Kineosporia sp. J2-2]|uniref:Dabb family protein n=1 Tax=Kineosporia corallincola TaxID=2835133 RepID=A0ABS5T8G1_9ACTN|nr:Dabb family protein [Kineosporia corallincola]MBT0767327.1 Dabb family protein [Kineosporia corallincola]